MAAAGIVAVATLLEHTLADTINGVEHLREGLSEYVRETARRSRKRARKARSLLGQEARGSARPNPFWLSIVA